jgi:hypothetical protein
VPEGSSVHIRQRCGCAPTPNGARSLKGRASRATSAKVSLLPDQFGSSLGLANCDSITNVRLMVASLHQTMLGFSGNRGISARSRGSTRIAAGCGSPVRPLTMRLSKVRRRGGLASIPRTPSTSVHRKGDTRSASQAPGSEKQGSCAACRKTHRQTQLPQAARKRSWSFQRVELAARHSPLRLSRH